MPRRSPPFQGDPLLHPHGPRAERAAPLVQGFVRSHHNQLGGPVVALHQGLDQRVGVTIGAGEAQGQVPEELWTDEILPEWRAVEHERGSGSLLATEFRHPRHQIGARIPRRRGIHTAEHVVAVDQVGHSPLQV